MAHISQAKQILFEHALDALVISSPLHIGYVTDFFGISPTERESFVVVTKKNCYILTSPLYFEDVSHTCNECIVIELSARLPWVKAIGEIVQQEKIDSLGFESYNLTVAEYNRLREVPATLSPVQLQNLRVIKDAGELALVKKACSIGDAVFEEILGIIKPGITEEDIAFEMELFMRKRHAVPSFPTIVACGPAASVPHHKSGPQKLEKNQFVLLDFGVQVQNFCSDMTRTLYIGDISSKEKKLYETVKEAQQKALDYLSSHAQSQSIQALEVDSISRDYITSRGFPSFPHSLGHGIGLEVHEAPSLSPYSKDLLTPGMVFSIEPGIYIPSEMGVRIEDLVTLTATSCEQLTLSSKELLVL